MTAEKCAANAECGCGCGEFYTAEIESESVNDL